MAAAIGGCAGASPLWTRDVAEAEMFAPVAMNFHSFTAIKDWTGDDDPDGIEAVIEFEDQFGDPTKASGTFLFELFNYRRADPEPRGRRIARWAASIQSLLDQRQRWSRISRTYSFQLADQPPVFRVDPSRSYVLTAQFQSSSGGRAFTRTLLLAQQPEVPSATQPATQPATGPASAPSTGPAGP
jgi:hypothetical protein